MLLDKFSIRSYGDNIISVELESWTTPFGRTYFYVTEFSTLSAFEYKQTFTIYDHAFDVFFELVERLRNSNYGI